MWRVDVQSDKLFLPLLPYCRVIFSVIDEDAILCIYLFILFIYLFTVIYIAHFP